MFEHFTFGAQAQSRYCRQDEISASPTDTSYVSTIAPPPLEYPFPEVPAINDIVNKLTHHTLRHEGHEDARPSIWADTFSSPTFEDAFTMEELSFVSTRRGITSLPSSTSVPNASSPSPSRDNVECRRLQRQLNTQLQSCRSHVKDINALVEDMITSNSQCTLHTSTSYQNLAISSSASRRIMGSRVESLVIDETMGDDSSYSEREIDPNDDEGFAEMEDPDLALTPDDETSLRIASTPSGIRKYNSLRFTSSMECSLSRFIPREKYKVRCVPRMRKRKRKVRSVPEE